MGASVSSTKTAIDVANEAVSKATSSALNQVGTQVSNINSISLTCTDRVKIKITEECARLQRTFLANPNISPEVLKLILNSPVCKGCDMDMKITQSNTRRIDVNTQSAIQMSTMIKSALNSEVDSVMSTEAGGGVGLSAAQTSAKVRIKNRIEALSESTATNDILNCISASNVVDMTNMGGSGIIMQDMAGETITKSIVTAIVATDMQLQSDIKTLLDLRTKATGFDIFGGMKYFVYILICFIALIVVGVPAFLLIRRSMRKDMKEPQTMDFGRRYY